MKLFGIDLRKPSSTEITAAAVMAVGLWMAALGLLHAAKVDIGRADAGALLLVVAWGCVSARLGIRIDLGRRHMLANVAVSAVLMGVYQGAWAFVT